MAQRAETVQLEYDRVFREYIRNLTREGWAGRSREPSAVPREVRTCASCGEHAAHLLDPEGTWYRCSACGQFA